MCSFLISMSSVFIYNVDNNKKKKNTEEEEGVSKLLTDSVDCNSPSLNIKTLSQDCVPDVEHLAGEVLRQCLFF